MIIILSQTIYKYTLNKCFKYLLTAKTKVYNFHSKLPTCIKKKILLIYLYLSMLVTCYYCYYYFSNIL